MKRVLMLAGVAAMMGSAAAPAAGQETAQAIFAGGCFWSVEVDFDKVDGVVETISGYIGGSAETANYQRVISDPTTGHYEAVEVTYDPSVVSYEELLTAFWHSIDPLDAEGQFCDKGLRYRTAIFTATPDEASAAAASLAEAEAYLGQPVATVILETAPFYPAEEYHQDYYLKNPEHYQAYRRGCGRDARVAQIWGDLAFSGSR